MRADLVRRVVVAVCAVLAVVGAFVGSGAAGGTPIQDAAGGALSADATLLAPAGPAFSIWSVIYLGLLGYAVWQLLPAQSRDGESARRQRTLGYPVAATLLLNAAWILSVQAGLLALSAVVIVVLLVALLVTFVLVVRTRRRGQGIVESVLIDGTVGLYLGWVCVATAANITALLTADGFDGWGIAADAWGVTIVVVAGLAGLALAVFGVGRLAPTASLAWGLVWVAVSRTTGETLSAPVATAAVITATALVVATVIIRLVAVGRERSAHGLATAATENATADGSRPGATPRAR
ncbi:tryptophan-rich sensory protein [Herbiconiux sp. KACC 21604]|uniref:tryptophan-rich sensory protein n=1 Tax=unclassified Herbiconiux TaxID=2618217 RepID=UPI00149208E7|nr:tryptophan-rich sensory protein [Herbiconiux sp. SALV-R1]QJU52303.1 tryptophan-rich sensory protein [Herbiconiux sp. SALV-R1]WPO87151.1 tryptophan-rich sensory protein [Herbiconiux sp. KACC 21604]